MALSGATEISEFDDASFYGNTVALRSASAASVQVRTRTQAGSPSFGGVKSLMTMWQLVQSATFGSATLSYPLPPCDAVT